MTIHNIRVCRRPPSPSGRRRTEVYREATPAGQRDDGCTDEIHDETLRAQSAAWGCAACGRDPVTEFAPRFHAHRLVAAGAVALSPSCHDIVHQSGGPDVATLMFRLRPSCPRCQDDHAIMIAIDPPEGPVPRGVTVRVPITHDDIPDFVCGTCDHEW